MCWKTSTSLGLEQRPVDLGCLIKIHIITKESSHDFLSFLYCYLKRKSNVTPSRYGLHISSALFTARGK